MCKNRGRGGEGGYISLVYYVCMIARQRRGRPRRLREYALPRQESSEQLHQREMRQLHTLMESEGVKSVIENHLDSFTALTHSDVALEIIKNYGYSDNNETTKQFFSFLDILGQGQVFKNLNADVAMALLKNNDRRGYSWYMVYTSFSNLPLETIPMYDPQLTSPQYLTEHSEMFKNPDAVKKVLNHPSPTVYAVLLDLALIDVGEGDKYPFSYEIFIQLISSGRSDIAVNNLQSFHKSAHSDIAKEILRVEGYEAVINRLPEFKEMASETRESIFNFMQEYGWDDVNTELVIWQFVRMVDQFGQEKVFKYIRRSGLTFHDAAHAMDKILDLYDASGLSSNEFYNNILTQIQADNATYESGTAHHQMNAMAQSMDIDVVGVMEAVKEYQDIPRLQELAKVLNTPNAVFASWTNLKRYSEIQQILERAEILEELKDLREEGKERLYQYIETLAFHPDSKVNMQAVLQFWREPEQFLDASDTHTPSEVQDRKKPSNYTHIPNLDLTAEELRDALVEGKMDTLQAFSPMEVRYTIPLERSEEALPIRDIFSQAIGKRSEGIKGDARNPNTLFSKANTLLKQYQPKRKKGEKPKKLNLVNYLNGDDIPEELIKPMEALLYDKDIGIPRPEIKTQEYVAKIFNKSDPEGAIAGDDTANCMPYGSGKNTVYTYNPNTAQFVIRAIKGDGSERTIAQSVITKDMDVHTKVPDIINKLQGHSRLEEVLPEDILTHANTYLACDNIEVAPNYTKNEQAIETIYRDFFTEYMERYGKQQGLNTEKVPIGTGYADALQYLPTEDNTYIPQAPISYSDKTGKEVYTLTLAEQEVQKNITEYPTEKKQEQSLPKGLSYLTAEDSIKVGYIEGKAYHDNDSLMESLFAMENALIAKDINNSAKDRPNLSIKYADSNDKMQGYILAYEGKITDEHLDYDYDEYQGQPCVYISDLAADRSNRMAGGRLIQGFADLYKQQYLEKNNPLPIYAQARESTSYHIIKRHLDKLGRQTGTSFKLTELPTYTQGGETMHPVIIEPVSE